MKYMLRISLLLLALIASGCGVRQGCEPSAKQGLGYAPLLGSSTDGISIENLNGQSIRLEFAALPADGQFLRLLLPAGRLIAEEQWLSDDYVLHVIGNASEGPEIGVRPVVGYRGSPVSVKLRTVAGEHVVSGPPSGPWNAVMDLEITDLGGGRIRLGWTEVNTGDYNFNSLVGVEDLTPLGVNFDVTYDPLIDGTLDNALFWVDGNRDGQIGISDLTPIGQHFGTRIIGYNVLRNGVVVHSQPGDPVTISREDAEIRYMLPPRYSVEFDSLPEDEWSVAPVDPEGSMGTDSNTVSLPFKSDLQVDLTIEGLDLFDLDGSGAFGHLGFRGHSLAKVVDPGEILRRIAEGDVPNLAAIGEGTDEDTPTPRFYDLPREQALALLVMYAPVADLSDGSPKVGSAARLAAQTISIDHETTVVPFRLPAGTDTSTLEIDIVFADNPAGGYFTNVVTEFTNGAVPTIASVRLDNLNRLIAMDNDGDDEPGLEFADEAQLADPDALAISDRRLERVIDTDDYGDPAEVQVYGFVDGWDEGTGALELRLVDVNHPVTGWSHLPSLTVLASEDSDFVGPDEADLEPSSLAVDDFVALDAELLSNTALDPADKYWLRKLQVESEPGPDSTISVSVTVDFNAFQGSLLGSLVRLLDSADMLVDQRFLLHDDGIPVIATFTDVPTGTYDVQVRRLITNWVGFGDTEAIQEVTVPPDASVFFVGEQYADPPPPG